MNYNFGAKQEEVSTKTGEKIKVWESPKYEASKQKAIDIIENGGYGVTEADFWILMNETKTKKMAYTGLIISHNGCLKINDKLENKVKPECFTLDKQGWNGSLVYTYCDEDTYEVGEVSSANCKNAYPYAMAFKRCFDRVVLKKSRLAYSGIYSEAEADEFRDPLEYRPVNDEVKENRFMSFIEEFVYNDHPELKDRILKKYSITDTDKIKDLDLQVVDSIVTDIKVAKEKLNA